MRIKSKTARPIWGTFLGNRCQSQCRWGLYPGFASQLIYDFLWWNLLRWFFISFFLRGDFNACVVFLAAVYILLFERPSEDLVPCVLLTWIILKESRKEFYSCVVDTVCHCKFCSRLTVVFPFPSRGKRQYSWSNWQKIQSHKASSLHTTDKKRSVVLCLELNANSESTVSTKLCLASDRKKKADLCSSESIVSPN